MINAALLSVIAQKRSPSMWTPENEASLIAWWDLSDLGSWSAGNFEWTNRFGSPAILKGWEGENGPTLIANGFGGSKAALLVDGANDTELFWEGINAADPFVAVVLNFTEPNTGVHPIVWKRGFYGIGSAGLQLNEDYGIQVRYGSGYAEHYDATWPGQAILVNRHSAAHRVIRYNGVEAQSITTNTNSGPPSADASFRLCPWDDTTNWTVEIAAVGIFNNSGWSTALAQKIEGFVAHSGLGVSTVLLPPGHPYKTTPPTP